VLPYPPTTAFAECRTRRVIVPPSDCDPVALCIGSAVSVVDHPYTNGPGVIIDVDGDSFWYGHSLGSSRATAYSQ
jgi:hypothetical protein